MVFWDCDVVESGRFCGRFRGACGLCLGYIEVTYSSKTSVGIYQIIRRHILGENIHNHLCDSFKPHIVFITFKPERNGRIFSYYYYYYIYYVTRKNVPSGRLPSSRTEA
jgi:hypothetical protein